MTAQRDDVTWMAEGFHPPDPGDDSCPALSEEQHAALKKTAMSEIRDMTQGLPRRPQTLLCELCCAPDSLLSSTCHQLYGKHSAVRMSDWNGCDMNTPVGVSLACRLVQHHRPKVLWISSDCGPFSPLQNLSKQQPQHEARLHEKQNQAQNLYHNCMQVARYARNLGLEVVWEWAQRSTAWSLPMYLEFAEELHLHTSNCNGCQVNLRNQEGKLMCKAWRMDTTWARLGQHLNLQCRGGHAKGRGLGEANRTTLYTPEFARRVCKFLHAHQEHVHSAVLEHWVLAGEQGAEREERDPREEEDPEGEEQRESEEGEEQGAGEAPAGQEEENPLTARQKAEILTRLRKIHSSTGHCSNKHLVQTLKRQGASQQVLRLARDFSCDVCREWSRPSPRHQASLHGISKKWETLLMDCGYWRHPVTQESWLFLMSVDEGSRLRVGQLLRTGSRAKIITEDVEKFLLERWFPVFGKPSVLRTDTESPLRSKQLDDFLATREVHLDHVPPEAHRQVSPVERTIQSTKDIMWKLSGEFPEMTTQELFCRALWAQNHRDLYLGYSPLQHAFGRTPQDTRSIGEQELRDLPLLTEAGVAAEHGHNVHAMQVAETAFLEAQAKERLRRAEAAGHRRMKHFCPGDLVYAWRKVVGRQDGNKNFTAGRFVGPFRVLATERGRGRTASQPVCVALSRKSPDPRGPAATTGSHAQGGSLERARRSSRRGAMDHPPDPGGLQAQDLRRCRPRGGRDARDGGPG